MRENKILRAVSYILLPILVGIVIISLLYTGLKESYSDLLDSSYFDTEDFTSEYMSYLANKTGSLIFTKHSNEVDGENRILYDYSNSNRTVKDSYFIIKYKNKFITNVLNYYTVADIMKFIEEQEGEKFILKNGKAENSSLVRKY